MSDARASQPPPDEAEYREQVLERFTARARSLTNQFTILMVFAFVFLVFIIVPLAELNFDAAHVDVQQAEIEALTEESKALEVKRTAQEEEVNTLRGKITSLNFILEQKRRDAEERGGERSVVEKNLTQNSALRQERQDQAQSLESAVQGMERTLASFDAGQRVDNLRQWFKDTAFAGNRDPDCEGDTDSAYLSCLVKQKLEADWERDFSLIRQEVIEPLRTIAPAVAVTIEGEMSAVKKTYRERLKANRDFWHSITGKEVFMGRLSDDFNHAFENIKDTVNLRLDKIAQQSAKFEEEIDRLAQSGQQLKDELAALDREVTQIEAEVETNLQELDGKEAAIAAIESAQTALNDQIAENENQLEALPSLTEIKKQRDDIETRLASFQSPFGAIPIGLKEAVIAYPLILAAGFMVCTLLMSRLLALRREFRNSLAQDKALSETNVARRVATLAPLWFDPDRALWANPALVLALFIPFALFFATAWLILNDWLLQLGDTDSAIQLRRFYTVLYALGLAAFAAGLVRVIRAWTQDRAMPASANPATPA